MFDHSPIIFHTVEVALNFYRRKFRFENSWLQELDLEAIVNEGWSFDNQVSITDKISKCTKHLIDWGMRLRRKFRDHSEALKKEMEVIRYSLRHEDNTRFFHTT